MQTPSFKHPELRGSSVQDSGSGVLSEPKLRKPTKKQDGIAQDQKAYPPCFHPPSKPSHAHLETVKPNPHIHSKQSGTEGTRSTSMLSFTCLSSKSCRLTLNTKGHRSEKGKGIVRKAMLTRQITSRQLSYSVACLVALKLTCRGSCFQKRERFHTTTKTPAPHEQGFNPRLLCNLAPGVQGGLRCELPVGQHVATA